MQDKDSLDLRHTLTKFLQRAMNYSTKRLGKRIKSTAQENYDPEVHLSPDIHSDGQYHDNFNL